MRDLDREMLLGYLMNALDENEAAHVERELLRQPKLRSELATLQKELSPLTNLYEEIEPPRNLARRTCDRLWATVDREERLGRFAVPMSSKVRSAECPASTDSAALAEILSVSPNLVRVIPSDFPNDHPSRRLIRRNDRTLRDAKSETGSPERTRETLKTALKPAQHKRRGRRLDILASVAVGVLIAVIAFPALNFAKNRAQYLITQNKIKEFQKGAGVYAQLQQGVPSEAIEEPRGVNLARSGWQEFDPGRLPMLLVDNDNTESRTILRESSPTTNLLPTSLASHIQPVSNTVPILAGNRTREIVLGQSPQNVEVNPGELSYQTLLSNIDHIVPLHNGSTVQTAFGQNVLFQNGRVFFRALPVFVPTNEASSR